MTAVSPLRSARQRTLPESAATPTTLASVSWTYCRTPPISAGTREEYAALSVKSVVRQTTSPLFLLSARIVPLGPPGVQTTLSPSTRTDSAYPQPDIILPPKSFSRLLCQTTFPVSASRQT